MVLTSEFSLKIVMVEESLSGEVEDPADPAVSAAAINCCIFFSSESPGSSAPVEELVAEFASSLTEK